MRDASLKTLSEIRSEVRAGSLGARWRAQVEEVNRKDSTAGKPYFELRLRDAADNMILRAWSDSPAFVSCEGLQKGDVVEVEGEFLFNGQFGLDARRWQVRQLTAAEAAELFDGDEDRRAAIEDDFLFIEEQVTAQQDPRLRELGKLFLSEFGSRFRRASAARHNHHAERGGLIRHTAQMLRAALAIQGVYPSLNRDLLISGVLFHDCGKLWETCPPEAGFEIPRDKRGELLGHISIGIELVNSLWRRLPLEDWKGITPATEDVRLHLLHLIAAHHGSLEFGSPVEPKTPEAIALHYVDNLDARMEMFTAAYARLPEIAPGIYERARTLNVSPVQALPRFESDTP